MAINPVGGAIPKDPTLLGAVGGTSEKNPISQQPTKPTRPDKFSKQFSVMTLVASGTEEDNCTSIGSGLGDTLDGSFSRQAMQADELRPVDLRHPSHLKDPLERRLESTVNEIFQRRKLLDSRRLVEAYGISSGESFSIQCWGDKQCDIPATCCSTFVCRWLCCCCSKCVTHSTPYEKLDKQLIRKECTTSYKECVETFSVYAPSWFVKLYLQMQNARWNEDTRFSTEDMLELKQEFFNEPHTPWIGIPPLMTGVNNMRMMTEVDSLLHDPLRRKPPWTQTKLVQPTRNSVELISTCKFLGIELSLELIAEMLLVLPTAHEDFSAPGVMRKFYNILASNIAVYSQPTPGSDLDPEMVLGLLLRILEKHQVPFTPSDILKTLAFDCNVFEDISNLSYETQSRTLAVVRKALSSRHQFWYDKFNATKIETSAVESEVSERGCSGCCTGCSSCCKPDGDQVDAIAMQQIITQQPATSTTGSLGRSMASLSSPAQVRKSKTSTPEHRPGIGYGLIDMGFVLTSASGGRSVRQDSREIDDLLSDE